jgi:hypothetical protein
MVWDPQIDRAIQGWRPARIQWFRECNEKVGGAYDLRIPGHDLHQARAVYCQLSIDFP